MSEVLGLNNSSSLNSTNSTKALINVITPIDFVNQTIEIYTNKSIDHFAYY